MSQSPPEELTYWEEIAQRPWGQYLAEVETRVILQAHRLASPPTLAIEIGCGGGRWTEFVTDLGWQMRCTEVNRQDLEACQKRVPSAECILVSPDDTTLPAPDDTIALLLCIEVPVIQAEWFTREAYRVLRAGGLVVGVWWNRLSWRGLYARFTDSVRDHTDFYKFTYSSWRQRLRAEGFALLHEEGLCWSPFSRESTSPLASVGVRVERFLGLHRLVTLRPWVIFIAQKT
jgi:SAM-dependent methyltransferase